MKASKNDACILSRKKKFYSGMGPSWFTDCRLARCDQRCDQHPSQSVGECFEPLFSTNIKSTSVKMIRYFEEFVSW